MNTTKGCRYHSSKDWNLLAHALFLKDFSGKINYHLLVNNFTFCESLQ